MFHKMVTLLNVDPLLNMLLYTNYRLDKFKVPVVISYSIHKIFSACSKYILLLKTEYKNSSAITFVKFPQNYTAGHKHGKIDISQ